MNSGRIIALNMRLINGNNIVAIADPTGDLLGHHVTALLLEAEKRARSHWVALQRHWFPER